MFVQVLGDFIVRWRGNVSTRASTSTHEYNCKVQERFQSGFSSLEKILRLVKAQQVSVSSDCLAASRESSWIKVGDWKVLLYRRLDHTSAQLRTVYENMAIRPPMTFSMTRQNPKWAKRSFGDSASSFNPVLMQRYFGMVKCIDDNVARLLDALEQLSLTERTIVVFTADHGDLCFEHGRLNKGNPYEGSAKIPMIIAAPGIIPPGSQIDQAMGTVDFMPTILSLISQAGGGDWQAGDGDWTLDENLQGRNAADLFRGKKDPSWNGVTLLRSANQQATYRDSRQPQGRLHSNKPVGNEWTNRRSGSASAFVKAASGKSADTTVESPGFRNRMYK